MMQEALRAGVERVVYTSSVATLALRADGGPADESVPLSVEEGIGAYKRSKIAAERLVEAMVGRERLPAVIVNPSTPIGPRDVKPTPTGRIIVEAARGRMPGFVDTGLNFVHVDDVAEGHLAALRRGRIGERYILGGENVVLADMLAEVARLAGRRPPRFRIPRAVVIPVAYLAEAKRPAHRARAVHDPATAAHRGALHVLHRGQGRARSRLQRAALPAGDRRRDRLVPRRRISGRQAETLTSPPRRAGTKRRAISPSRRGGAAARAITRLSNVVE